MLKTSLTPLDSLNNMTFPICFIFKGANLSNSIKASVAETRVQHILKPLNILNRKKKIPLLNCLLCKI